MVIFFDRHHVFQRFRFLPFAATEALEATSLICTRRRHLRLHILAPLKLLSETPPLPF